MVGFRPGLRRAIATAAALLALALAAAPAASAAGNPALTDCIVHQRLTRTYPVSVLKNALRTMTPTTRQYSDCQDVFNQALLAAVGRSHREPPSGTGGGTGSFLPTPVIVILAVLLAGALAMGAVAVRRGQGLTGGPGPREEG